MSDLVEGGPCQVFKNGWRPAVLIKMGRKHAVVKFADKETNSHVPATSVKELSHSPKAPAPPAEEKEEDGYFMDEKDESYLKIKHRSRIIAIVPRAYRSEADTMLNALRDTESVNSAGVRFVDVAENKTLVVPPVAPEKIELKLEEKKPNDRSALDRL